MGRTKIHCDKKLTAEAAAPYPVPNEGTEELLIATMEKYGAESGKSARATSNGSGGLTFVSSLESGSKDCGGGGGGGGNARSRENQGDKLPQCAAALIVTFAHFTSGYAMGWTSPALPILMGGKSPVLNVQQAGWVGSLYCIGGALGTPLAGGLADRLGRKWTAIITAVPFIISWTIVAIMGVTTSPFALYIARIFSGLSAGALTVVAPMYVAETAQPSIRGALGGLIVVTFNLGLLAVYSAGAVFEYLPLALLGFVPVVIFLSGCVWLPESPVLLLRRGQRAEARRSLQKLRGSRFDVDAELETMEAVAEEEAQSSDSDSLLLLVRRSKGLRRAFCITLGIMTGQQMCGIAAILTYTADIFKESGSEIDPNSAAVIVGALQFVFTAASTLVLDRAGRRPLLIGSSALIALSLLGLGSYFEARKAGVDVSAISWLPVLALSLYIVFLSGGVGPVPWVLLGEVFPARVRGQASALVAMWCWTLSSTLTLVFPPLLEVIGLNGAVWLFSGGCVITSLFAYFFCPETKGKTLEQIMKELEN